MLIIFFYDMSHGGFKDSRFGYPEAGKLAVLGGMSCVSGIALLFFLFYKIRCVYEAAKVEFDLYEENIV